MIILVGEILGHNSDFLKCFLQNLYNYTWYLAHLIAHKSRIAFFVKFRNL